MKLWYHHRRIHGLLSNTFLLLIEAVDEAAFIETHKVSQGLLRSLATYLAFFSGVALPSLFFARHFELSSYWTCNYRVDRSVCGYQIHFMLKLKHWSSFWRMAVERRCSFPPAAKARDGFRLHLGEGLGVDLAASEIAGAENGKLKLMYRMEQF